MQFIIKILNYKESLLKISKHRCEIQQKFSEIMNVSIQILKKPTKFSKIFNKIHEKVYKKVKILQNMMYKT